MSEQSTQQAILRLLERIANNIDAMHADITGIKGSLTRLEARAHDLEGGVSSVMAAVGLSGCTKQFDETPICYVNRALRAAKYQEMMNYPG